MELVNLNFGLSVEALDALIGSRDHLDFLNPRNQLYRAMELKSNPPSREDALRLMSKHPNLIKRPVVVRGDRVVLGFAPDELAGFAKE